jgi:hypothetical protein
VLQPQDLVQRIIARCQSQWAAGKTVVWSFKPLPAAVASGAWKPYVLALGKYLSDNKLQSQTVVVIWHEPENDFGHPADFVSMFNAVHDWLTSVDPTIVTSHAAMAWWFRDGAMTDAVAQQWVTRCTIHSIDIYSGRSFPLAMTLATSAGFRRWNASRPAYARWGVAERGWIALPEESAARVAAINAEAAYLDGLSVSDQPDFYCIWNTSGQESDPTIVLDQPATDAVNGMFTRLLARRPAIVVPPSHSGCPLCAGAGHVRPGAYTIARI